MAVKKLCKHVWLFYNAPVFGRALVDGIYKSNQRVGSQYQRECCHCGFIEKLAPLKLDE